MDWNEQVEKVMINHSTKEMTSQLLSEMPEVVQVTIIQEEKMHLLQTASCNMEYYKIKEFSGQWKMERVWTE